MNNDYTLKCIFPAIQAVTHWKACRNNIIANYFFRENAVVAQKRKRCRPRTYKNVHRTA